MFRKRKKLDLINLDLSKRDQTHTKFGFLAVCLVSTTIWPVRMNYNLLISPYCGLVVHNDSRIINVASKRVKINFNTFHVQLETFISIEKKKEDFFGLFAYFYKFRISNENSELQFDTIAFVFLFLLENVAASATVVFPHSIFYR